MSWKPEEYVGSPGSRVTVGYSLFVAVPIPARPALCPSLCVSPRHVAHSLVGFLIPFWPLSVSSSAGLV